MTQETISLRLIGRLMDDLGLVAAAPRPYKRTTVPDQAPTAIADLLRRDFTATAPGAKLVGDITFVRTWEGWLYLATVIDCHSRKVIGFLPRALANGTYLPAPEPHVVGSGLEHIQTALDTHRRGVSAQKIVVTIPS